MNEANVGREPVQVMEIILPRCTNTHGSAPCTATQTGNGKCFNTRATCNDTDNYQARPLSHLTADQLWNDGDTVTVADLTTNASFMLEFEGWIGSDPSGTIFGVGGAGDGDHVYLGFTGDDFVFSVGGVGGQTRITVDKSEVAGSTCTIIATSRTVDLEAGLTLHDTFARPSEISFSDLSRNQPAVFACDFTGLTPSGDGIIFEAGGAFVGASLCVEGSNIVLRGGGGGAQWPASAVSYIVAPCPTGDGTLVWEFTPGPGGSVRLWWNGEQIGSVVDAGGGISGDWAGTDNAGAFQEGGTQRTTDSPAVGFAGFTTASGIRYYENETVTETETNEIALYRFCHLSFRLRELGRATASGGTWASATDGEVGDSAAAYTGEDGGALDKVSVDVIRWHDDQFIALDTDPEAYRQRYLFDDGRGARPAGGDYILPLLSSVDTVGTKINIAGADDRYEPIGRRAFLSANFADGPHPDTVFDPYLQDRDYNPMDRGTFWTKWLRRNKFGKTRGLVRVYHGYDGQPLSAMQRQSYVLDALSWEPGRVNIKCRDFLTLTEFRRAQVPAASPGRLASAISDTDTSLALTGDQVSAYPASGTLRIGNELMTYSGGLTYDSLTDETTIGSLTRGTDGSTAASHDQDEGVQLCRRYTDARIDDVLEDLLLNDARVPAQVVDMAKITQQYDDYLDAYTLTTLISEPTGVDQLIGEIAEQCGFYVWWNERVQVVDMQAIRPLDSVDATLTDEENIIDGSFSLMERPKERLTTITMYYNPRDFAGDLASPVNFKNYLIVSNSTAQGADQYGNLPQTREIFSRWLTTQAQVNQTGSRYSVRYQDVPLYAELMVDAKDRALWAGDFVSLSHPSLVDARGARDESRRWLIVEAEEVEPGHAQKLTLADVTLDGSIYVITENGLPDYTPALFGAGNAFITNNDGTNPDGSQGATIG